MSFSEWKEIKFKDICDYKTGKLNSNAAEENGIYPFFTCSPEPYKINSYSFDQEAILLAGNNANGKFHINYYKGKFDAYQRTYVIATNDETIVDNTYLYYYLSLQLNHLKEISVGSATRFLTKGILDNISIKYPKYDEMKYIGKTLRSIDEKIELNNQMNKTLEEMAQALFKRWFVDFEFPNEDGETYKSSGGEMVDSELGMIPNGWETTTLSEVGEVVAGGTPSTKNEEYYDGDIPWITPRDLSGYNKKFISRGERSITALGLQKSSAKLMPKNSVLFSSRAPIGYVVISNCEVCTNQGFKSIVCNENKVSYNYIYWLLKTEKEKIESVASGSTFKEVSGKTMKEYKIILPKKEILDKFITITDSFDNLIKKNEIELDKLQETRDTLLPKLMSGEIRVSDIEI